MRKSWTYALSVIGYAIIAYGVINLIGDGVDAYMVGVTGAHPGDAIYLDELASPLSESLPWLACWVVVIGLGLWSTALARKERRKAVSHE